MVNIEAAPAWKPRGLDLALASLIAVSLPVIASRLYGMTGALLPMSLYYVVAWGLIKWRRGSTGYFKKLPARITPYFRLHLGVILVCLACAYGARIRVGTVDISGVLATALVWAPLNAATEQLLWIYLFEAWDLYPVRKSPLFSLVGLLLFAFFVGMIHALFWARFLTTVDPGTIFGLAFILLTTISGFLHLVVWRKSGHMILTFIPHFLLNLIPLAWTGYSILPHLLR